MASLPASSSGRTQNLNNLFPLPQVNQAPSPLAGLFPHDCLLPFGMLLFRAFTDPLLLDKLTKMMVDGVPLNVALARQDFPMARDKLLHMCLLDPVFRQQLVEINDKMRQDVKTMDTLLEQNPLPDAGPSTDT